MELLLEVRVGGVGQAARIDCRVTADPDLTIGALSDALRSHADDRDVEAEEGAALWTDEGVPLDPEQTVRSAGIRSGSRLWLSSAPVAPDVGDRVAGSAPAHVRDVVDASGGVAFNRTPYRPVPVMPRTLDPLPPPPTPSSSNRIAITSFVVPLASGVGFAVVLGRPQFLVIAALAPVALLVATMIERRRGRSTARAAKARYHALVSDAVVAAARAVEDEAGDRRRALPSLGELRLDARTRRPTLWARGRDAPDLLTVRLGTGSDHTRVTATIAPGGDEVVRAEVWARLEAVTDEVHDVPVSLDLDSAVVVGIHDDPGAGATAAPTSPAAGLARSVLGQIVAQHGPEDVVIAALLAPSVLWELEWLRWLPHVRSAASPLPGAHLAIWPETVAEVLGTLLDVAADRGAAGGAGQEAARFPRIVVVVHEESPIDRAALGRLLDLAPDAGIRVLWIGRHHDLLPRQCRVIATVTAEADGSRLTSTDPSVATRTFTAELADSASVDELARDLAPLRDVSSVARVGAIPRRVGLADVLAPELGGTIDASSVRARWEVHDGSTLAAPIGVGPDGPLSLDLVDHGPHALIAGTSGAGKSELLQSMVASMAACHPPSRLTFLFIDYKGGAAAAAFAGLPHQVGVVTNLDPSTSRRALTSLGAELDRRMALLAELDDPSVKDLGDLARVGPDRCPPRLVIVIDEFATLVKEIPDFVAGIVDIAQRGRSLGIHLVLATQRPAGAVNENILANTNLRIALRVVDTADSQNVIGSGQAAEIPVPLRGRGYARVGPSDLVPFQSAWSGAPRRAVAARSVVVRPFGFETSTDEVVDDDGGGTQLDAVLDAVVGAFGASPETHPRRPWLPPLAGAVDLADVEVTIDPLDRGRLAVVGVRDDPARQRRVPAVVDLEVDGGLAVFGAGGSGRTTALRTVAASLVRGARSDEVQLIGLDFAGRGLLPLLHLPHTRVVATAEDLEATARVIDLLVSEIARRRTLLGEAMVDTLGVLRTQRGAPVVPRIVVLVDGFASLRTELDQPASYDWFHRLQRVALDGRAVGIHLVISADRRADLPSAVLGAIGARLVLRMPEPEAMTSLGVPLALARGADLPAGRGFLAGDHEVQVAVVGGAPAATAQATAFAGLVPDEVPPAPKDTPLPDEIARPALPDGGLRVTIGVADGGEPAGLDLGGGHLLVTGPPASGRSTTLAAVIDALRHPTVRPVRVCVVAPGHSPLAEPGALEAGVAGAFTPEEQTALLEELLATTSPDARTPEAVLVVDDGEDLDEGQLGTLLEQVAGRPAIRVAAAVGSGALARAFSGWVAAVRRGRRMVVLRPDDAAEVDQLAGARMRFRPGIRFPPGRAVLVVDRRPTVVQIGQPPVG